MRTSLAVLGVVLAVLATTLLAGTGIGVVETGQEKFDQSGRDLWIIGGPVQLTPGIGGVKPGITDAHDLQPELVAREEIDTAPPLYFQTTYVGSNRSDFRTIVGVGMPSSEGLSITEGRGFNASSHYAGGTYDGPWTHEVVIDSRTAELFGVDVGDTLYVGGTIATAKQHEFRVVGISPTNSRFLGAPTVSMPLSEMQELTGATATDPASLVSVKLEDGYEPNVVERELQTAYPEYDVRTNQEQLQATIERQAVVIAGGASLVVLAFVGGLALTLNVVLSLIQSQRETFAALKAVGCSARTLSGVVVFQAIFVGGVGALVAISLAVPLASSLDWIAATVTGFENVVRMPAEIVFFGGVVAVLMSLVSSVVSAWRLRRLAVLRIL
jgi:putative ABC transport system permease protein